MAQARLSTSTNVDTTRDPHALSLKVLRLSRPTLATQNTLPSASIPLSACITPTASTAYPSHADAGNAFSITPLLTLPPAFGNAYIGETFSCTLSANNELALDVSDRVSNVRLEVEMKTPSLTLPLDVTYSPNAKNTPGNDLEPTASLQGIISHYLREEGTHILAVTVSYNETSTTSGRLRTFRKLYQFVARPALVVRSKISAFGRGRWALEAQLENVSEVTIVLVGVEMEAKGWCKGRGLHNWKELGKKPVLMQGDVQQVCFLVEESEKEVDREVDVAGRTVMGMLHINWRGAMGSVGNLSTSWLGVRIEDS